MAASKSAGAIMRSNPTLSVATNLKLAYALFLAPLVFLFYVMVSQAVSIDDPGP